MNTTTSPLPDLNASDKSGNVLEEQLGFGTLIDHDFTFELTEHQNEVESRVVKSNSWKSWIKNGVLGLEGDGSYFQENFISYYVGTIYFGGGFDNLNVVWDTGSDWTQVMGFTCTSCSEHAVYDYTDQIGQTFTEQPGTSGGRSFGTASASGFVATD